MKENTVETFINTDGPSSSSVRRVRTSDAAQIAEIYGISVLHTAFTFDVEPPSAEEISSRIEKLSSQKPWLVMEFEGEVAGYAYASSHRERAAYQWAVEVSIYVSQKFQRQGVAKTLYKMLLPILKAQGFCKAYAGITLPNKPSVSLHEFFGFTHLGTYQDVGYKLGKWHNVGWWELTLNRPAVAPQPPLCFAELLQQGNYGLATID